MSRRWHFVLRCTKYGPLGPLFYLRFIHHVSHCTKGNCLYYVNLAPDTFSLTMKYNMFKGMVHFGWCIDTYLSLHTLFKFLLSSCDSFFSGKPERDSKGATRCPLSVRTLFAFSTFFFFFRILVDSSTLPKGG